jgi:signal transduction histidine kinase
LPAGDSRTAPPLRGLGKLFGDLPVSRKLLALHNFFFLLLACGVYFSLIPLFENRVTRASAREVTLVTQMFSEGKPLLRLPGMELYDYQEGPAAELQIPADVARWLDAHPGVIWQRPTESDFCYRKDPATGLYRRLKLPVAVYREIVSRAKWTLFIVLGAIYLVAVLLLERVIMPLYVLRPLHILLDADKATQRGDREHELVDERLITRDEIGQFMRSRNATVAQLRRHEDDLEQAAEDLRQKNEMLADQDRLVSLGMLSASVAHELNTPLSVLRGSIEKLMETVDEEPERGRLVRMLRVTDRLRRISEGFLDFARVRKQEMEPVAIRPLVEEAWELVAIDERASMVSFSNLVEPGDVVTGNADRLIQLFVNLLRNALNAVKSSGAIVVRSARFASDGQSWVAVAVEDDGAGIPADVLPNLFEAFVTSRLDARGTGLGLTVAEGIVHQHGGRIVASNRTGGGARLEVTLPAADGSS